MFKRVFQLTQQQPIDECLALLGDCMVADLDSHAVQPVVNICRTTVTDLSVRARAWRRLPYTALGGAQEAPLSCVHSAIAAADIAIPQL